MPRVEHNAYLAALTDMFYPQRCVSCERRANDVLCRTCHDDLPHIGEPRCMRCGYPTAFEAYVCGECEDVDFGFDSAGAPLRYEGVGKSLVHSLKYGGYFAAVQRVMVPLMVRSIREGRFDSVVPVPMHRTRKRKRGFNQAEIIASGIGKKLGVRVNDGMKVVRLVGDQVHMTAEGRAQNVRGAFACGERVGGKVLLVDDVFTTGATMSECARVLLADGASEVHAVSLCRTCQ